MNYKEKYIELKQRIMNEENQYEFVKIKPIINTSIDINKTNNIAKIIKNGNTYINNMNKLSQNEKKDNIFQEQPNLDIKKKHMDWMKYSIY